MKKMMLAAAAAALMTAGIANAQMTSPGAPMPGSAPMSAPVAPAPSMAPGSSYTATQTTQTTTSADPGYYAESTTETETLPNAGGEPLILVFGGLMMAGSAFALRRRFN